jgi:predicted GIY-YIG superfamily endonuclease
MSQVLLFPDPRPLVERLGREFFRQLPERPGVYLMRDAQDAVLYVGKAKNLRKRLGSYRVANPDRMARRHLRLLRAVERIELQECGDETSALAREAELLRSLKPKFNRAGTWPGKPRFLNWRIVEGNRLELAVGETAEAEWQSFGPMGASLFNLHAVLARLIWFAVNPELGFVGMPAGWAKGSFGSSAMVHCGGETENVSALASNLFGGEANSFCEWVRARTGNVSHAFEKTALQEDLEFVEEFCEIAAKKNARSRSGDF